MAYICDSCEKIIDGTSEMISVRDLVSEYGLGAKVRHYCNFSCACKSWGPTIEEDDYDYDCPHCCPTQD